MKTKPEIAKAILERRNRMTHVIIPGDINAAIGPDGVAEALKERWLVPDTDSGFLCATNDLVKVEEMRKLAEMKPEQYAPEAIAVSESHDHALLHTQRKHALNEVAPPGTGAPSPGLTAIAQPNDRPMMPPSTPAAPPPAPTAQAPAPQAAGGYPVGTPVTVARQGISATGMIEKLLPDGRYKLGFTNANGQKPPGDDIFSKEEMTAVPNK